jgi:hypothetical protein
MAAITCLAVAVLKVLCGAKTPMSWRSRFRYSCNSTDPLPVAFLDHAGACTGSAAPASGVLKPLLAYTDEAFPQASLTVEVDRGPIKIRTVLARQNGACKVTVIFSLPLGSELTKRLPSVDRMEVTAVSLPPFGAYAASRRVLGTLKGISHLAYRGR